MRKCKAPNTNCQFEGTETELRVHAKEVHGITIYPCHECDVMFWTKDELRHHHRNHHSENSNCIFCNEACPSHGALNLHLLKMHQVEMGFIGFPGEMESSPLEWPLKVFVRDHLGTPVADENLIERAEYLVKHDENKLLWGFHVITKEKLALDDLGEDETSRERKFQPDDQVPYLHFSPWGIHEKEFVCGHICPARDFRHSKAAYEDSMMMGNIVPQLPQHNAVWRTLEDHCRKLTDFWPRIPCFTIPIYGANHLVLKTIDCCNMHVADAFAKIVVLHRPDMPSPLVQVFKIPHQRHLDRASIFHYRSSLEEIAELTGIRFLPADYVNTWDLQQHHAIHRCEERNCNQGFLSEEVFEEHKALHQEQFRCLLNSCNRFFPTEEERDNHMGSHPRHDCPHCEKVFFDNTIFTEHLSSHTGERPYKCDFVGCDRTFTNSKLLRDHKKRDHGDDPRPWKCQEEGCTKTFTQSIYLSEHKRSHHGDDPKPFKCQEEGCDKEYATYKQLHRHRQKHSGEMFQCHLCDRSYVYKETLRRHLRLDHPNETEPQPTTSRAIASRPVSRTTTTAKSKVSTTTTTTSTAGTTTTSKTTKKKIKTTIENFKPTTAPAITSGRKRRRAPSISEEEEEKEEEDKHENRESDYDSDFK